MNNTIVTTNNPTPLPELAPMLKQLRLSGITESLNQRNREAIEHKMTYPEFLALIIQDEAARRDQKKYGTRLRRAGFRSDKTLEWFDFDFDPNIDRALIRELASCRFTNEKVSVLITGLCGTGKSHIAQAIGHCAVRQGIDVLFTSHWHIDISYINLGGTFYYLCCLLDGYSRFIVEWDIKTSMKEADIEIIIEKAREKYPDCKPRIISDNGPQFIAKDFKQYIRLTGMTHVRTSPYYPQSNGKIERFHKTIKGDHIRQQQFADLDELKSSVGAYKERYNTERLHSAIGYVTPAQKLNGQEKEIFKRRENKLNQAREERKARRQQARSTAA